MARLLTLCAGLAAFGGLLLSAWVVLRSGSAISQEAFAKIETGMTLGQVEDILGGPERDESTGTLLPRDAPDNGPMARLDVVLFTAKSETRVEPAQWQWQYWVSNTTIVAVD